MGFLSTAVQAEQARHTLRQRNREDVEKAIETKAELIEKAMDFAEEDYEGDVPDAVQIAIFQDPGAYIKAGEPDESESGELESSCEDCESEYDYLLEKEYVGFDALVKKLMAEHGVSEERAKKIAASIGRKKYGAKFNKPASSHH